MVQQDRPLVMQLLYWKMTLNLKGQLREMNSHVRQTLLRKWIGADVLNHLRIQILTTFFSVWKRDMELPEIRMLREPLILLVTTIITIPLLKSLKVLNGMEL